METEYSMIDPWGNEYRNFPSAESGMEALAEVSNQAITSPLVAPNRARIYMEERVWDKPIQQLVDAMEKLNETETK